jgi:hypothetical protein
MASITFEVGSINERVVTTKFGQKKVYDLLATDGTKYSYGFKDPARAGIAVGTTISGEATIDRFGTKLDPDSVRLGGVPTGTGGPSPLPVSPPSYTKKAWEPTPAKVFPVPATHGDMAIIRQNALTNAVSTVADFVATQPAEKWPDLDKWSDMVITIAYKYQKFSSGHRELEAIGRLQDLGVNATDINTAVDASIKGAE